MASPEPAAPEGEGRPGDPGASAAALLRRALAEATAAEVDEGAYWEPVLALQRCEPSEVWSQLLPLARHGDERVRALVADVLRFLGGEARPLREQTVELFGMMLQRETSPHVLASLGAAFVDLDHPRGPALMLPFSRHPDPRVRGAVVHALLGNPSEAAIEALIGLSRDPAPRVRSWATFGLGSQLGEPGDGDLISTPALRDALAARLDDPDDETRAEATVGLAMRGDRRALPLVKAELERGPTYAHYIEAAYYLAAPELRDPLQRLTRWLNEELRQLWQSRPYVTLQQALDACSKAAE